MKIQGGPYEVITEQDNNSKWWALYVPSFNILTMSQNRDDVEQDARELIANWLSRSLDEIEVAVVEGSIPPDGGQQAGRL